MGGWWPTARGWGASARGSLRRALGPLRLTPRWLRLLSVVLVLGVAGRWVLSVGILQVRRSATDDVSATAFPLLERTSELYAALADADTTASRGFLEPGDPVDLRRRYDEDLARATALLAEVAQEAERSAAMEEAVGRITAALPVYADHVASARADERQGLVMGSAYLRMASDLMRAELLPGARTLYVEAAGQLDGDQRSATRPAHVVAVLAAGGLVLLTAVGAQVALALRTRRTLNLRLLGASAAVVVAVGAVAGLLAVQQQAMDRAEREGADLVKLLGAGRILALRAQSDANLALIERGTGQEYLDDYAETSVRLGAVDPATGILGAAARARALAGAAGSLAPVADALVELRRLDARVRELDDANQYEDSVRLALTDQAQAALSLDDALVSEIRAGGERFTANVATARRGILALALAVTALSAAAAGLVLAGFRPRIREYR